MLTENYVIWHFAKYTKSEYVYDYYVVFTIHILLTEKKTSLLISVDLLASKEPVDK